METAAVKGELQLNIGSDGGSDGGISNNLQEVQKTSAKLEEIVKPVIETVIIKEEEEGSDEAVLFSGGAEIRIDGAPTRETDSMPKPLENLHDNGPPPFLTKTFDMVEDPETDEVVSWSSGSDSFVVWDPHKLSLHLLPKYFKHCNFSSFIRQLNTYGFRKVHLDRWEFANSGFQRGKKHMLKSIKRRSHNSYNSKDTRGHEVEKLKKEHDTLKLEVLGLKQKQEKTDESLVAMEERLRQSEWKQKQMMFFIARAIGNGTFAQQFMDNCKQRKSLVGGEVLKKRRILGLNGSTESSYPMMGTATITNATPALRSGKADMSSTVQQETNSLRASYVEVGEQKSSLTSAASSPELSSGDYIMLEKLMADEVICEDWEVIVGDQSRMVLELEDLITKPVSCGSCAKELLSEVGCAAGSQPSSHS